jgi:hypothetical protein
MKQPTLIARLPCPHRRIIGVCGDIGGEPVEQWKAYKEGCGATIERVEYSEAIQAGPWKCECQKQTKQLELL